jgi:hypothetical protein
LSVGERAVAAWQGFWFAPDSPYPLAAFRILLGIYLLGYLSVFAPHVSLLFSAQGVYLPYLMPDPMAAVWVAWLLFALMWFGALALCLGFYTRITIPILLLGFLYHYFLALGVKQSSFERLIVIYLLALAPSGCDRVWSLTPPMAAHLHVATVAFAGRIVRFQTIVLYLGAGLWKVINPGWRSGALLWSTLQGIWATPLAFRIIRAGWSAGVWITISRSVIAGELLLGALLCFKRTRLFGVALGVLFHVLNSVILSIPEFLVCLAPYPLFVPAHIFVRLDRFLASSFARWRRALQRRRDGD